MWLARVCFWILLVLTPHVDKDMDSEKDDCLYKGMDPPLLHHRLNLLILVPSTTLHTICDAPDALKPSYKPESSTLFGSLMPFLRVRFPLPARKTPRFSAQLPSTCIVCFGKHRGQLAVAERTELPHSTATTVVDSRQQ